MPFTWCFSLTSMVKSQDLSTIPATGVTCLFERRFSRQPFPKPLQNDLGPPLLTNFSTWKNNSMHRWFVKSGFQTSKYLSSCVFDVHWFFGFIALLSFDDRYTDIKIKHKHLSTASRPPRTSASTGGWPLILFFSSTPWCPKLSTPPMYSGRDGPLPTFHSPGKPSWPGEGPEGLRAVQQPFPGIYTTYRRVLRWRSLLPRLPQVFFLALEKSKSTRREGRPPFG